MWTHQIGEKGDVTNDWFYEELEQGFEYFPKYGIKIYE